MRLVGSALVCSLIFLCAAIAAPAEDDAMELSPNWEYVSDRVMGGVSSGVLQADTVGGRRGARLRGQVSLDNNGGFVQMAFDLAEDGATFDASGWTGIAFDVFGNSEQYEVRLRTTALTRPWQSFRAPFNAARGWRTVQIPFDSFEAHRTEAAFDLTQLRRVGVLAIGRVFEADITIAGVRFYR